MKTQEPEAVFWLSHHSELKWTSIGIPSFISSSTTGSIPIPSMHPSPPRTSSKSRRCYFGASLGVIPATARKINPTSWASCASFSVYSSWPSLACQIRGSRTCLSSSRIS